MRWEVDAPLTGPTDRAETRALERFLFEIERRAYRIARIAVQNDDDALDIVQDSMLQLARRYGQHPSDQWRPLFFRVLQNRIRDCLRRRKVRGRFLGWLPVSRHEENAPDPLEQVADDRPQPLQHAVTDKAMQVLELALAALPARQQEAFMLRNFEGLDVAQTARAMGCSEGSVKTHYSRAVHSLRDRLGDVW